MKNKGLKHENFLEYFGSIKDHFNDRNYCHFYHSQECNDYLNCEKCIIGRVNRFLAALKYWNAFKKKDLKVFKVCWKCGIYFPAELQSFNCYCPDHQEFYKKSLIERIKHDRYIDAEYLDVYNDIPYFPIWVKTDKDKEDYIKSHYRSPRSFPLFERVCRSCGSRLLNKNGKYNPRRRQCGKTHVPEIHYYNWSSTKNDYRWELWIKQGERYKSYEYKTWNHLKATEYIGHDRIIKCEDCGKDVLYYDISIHHKIEVNQLTEENIMLLWSFDNLLALCYDCHCKKRHGWKNPRERKAFNKAKKIQEIREKHIPLDKFM